MLTPACSSSLPDEEDSEEAGDLAPTCPPGEVFSMEYECIPIQRCGCVSPGDCPEGTLEANGHPCLQLTNLQAEPVYFGEHPSCQVQLDWDILNVGGSRIQHYRIHRNEAPIGEAAHTFFVDESAPSGQLNRYAVSVVDQAGIESSLSEVVEIMTPDCSGDATSDPSAYRPRSFEASPIPNRCTRAQLLWDAPEAEERLFGYHLYLDGEFRQELAKTSVALGANHPLSPDSTHQYTLIPLYAKLDEDGNALSTIRLGPASSASLETPACHRLPHNGGTLAGLYFLHFADTESGSALDIATIEERLTGERPSVADFYDRVSYGNQHFHLRHTTPWLQLPGAASDYCDEFVEQEDGSELAFFPSCDLQAIASDGNAIAAELEAHLPLDFEQLFEQRMFIINGVSPGAYTGHQTFFSGLQSADVETLSHEFGHTLGLPHTGTWRCDDYPSVGPSLHDPWAGACEAYIYGDAIDPMAVRLRHLSAYHKYLAGFLTPDHFKTVLADGEYILNAIESDTAEGATMALRLPLFDDSAYIIEYRVPRDYDANEELDEEVSDLGPRVPIVDGLALWYRSRFHSDHIRQIQVDGNERFVTPERDFYDPFRRIRIKLLERLPGERARVQVQYDAD